LIEQAVDCETPNMTTSVSARALDAQLNWSIQVCQLCVVNLLPGKPRAVRGAQMQLIRAFEGH
jgi:hypothetical protein